ncbi:MAG: PEP-CTERM sorting domain-containing protein [Verrucomicrobiota bacterium]
MNRFFSFAFSTTAVVALPLSAHSEVFAIGFDFDEDGAPLQAGVVDLAANQPYQNIFGPGLGLTVSTDNPSSRPLNLYNSEGTGGSDDDLERLHGGGTSWAEGNLGSTAVGNLLIVNEDTDLDDPDDDAAGGTIRFEFDLAIQQFAFDFIDMDKATDAEVIFTDNVSGSFVTIGFEEFEDGFGGIWETSGVSFGDRAGNRIEGISAEKLGLDSFDEIEFVLSSSGGIGSLFVTPVPEPSSALLLSFSSLLLLRRHRGR